MIEIIGKIKESDGVENKNKVIFTFDTNSIKESIELTNMGSGLITDPINSDQFLTEAHAVARVIAPGEQMELRWSVPEGLHAFNLKYLEINVISRSTPKKQILATDKYFELLQNNLEWAHGANGSVSVKLKDIDQSKPFIQVSKQVFNPAGGGIEDLQNIYFSYGFIFSFKTTAEAHRYYGRIDPLVKIGSLDGEPLA
jgi:hypothetical protein